MAERHIGTVTHYYPKAHAAAVRIEEGELHVGDTIHIQGNGVDVEETVESLQIDREPIEHAEAGQEVGVLVHEPVKEGAEVLLVGEA